MTAMGMAYPMETPDPYPMPENSVWLIEWLRGLWWRVE